jgi:hypothetical protein
LAVVALVKGEKDGLLNKDSKEKKFDDAIAT